uniref:(northern house mosquito) hypothetical protein n=1 Tax=Culex pipiens TaxID=7175 RepID=A0A8D8DS07_CULPI
MANHFWKGSACLPFQCSSAAPWEVCPPRSPSPGGCSRPEVSPGRRLSFDNGAFEIPLEVQHHQRIFIVLFLLLVHVQQKHSGSCLYRTVPLTNSGCLETSREFIIPSSSIFLFTRNSD